VTARRIRGWEFRILPGGGAGPDSSPWEKVYVCLAGSVTVIIDGVETVLNSMDSLTVAPNEVRETINRENDVATTLVVMPHPPA
jgi:quercetin dioxygenase-like cupin family protein